MWLTYEEFSDADGISYPGGIVLAEAMGHRNDNHVSRFRRILIGHGLIEVVEKGGGRGRPMTIRMLIPPQISMAQIPLPYGGESTPDRSTETLPDIGGDYETPNPPIPEVKPPHSERANPPIPEVKPPHLVKSHNKEDQLNTSASESDKRSRRRDDDRLEEEFPSPLNTDHFKQVWADWKEARKEIKKPLTLRAEKMQLEQLSAYGEIHAIATIKASIAGQWQGLFPDKVGGNGRSRDKSREVDDMVDRAMAELEAERAQRNGERR